MRVSSVNRTLALSIGNIEDDPNEGEQEKIARPLGNQIFIRSNAGKATRLEERRHERVKKPPDLFSRRYKSASVYAWGARCYAGIFSGYILMPLLCLPLPRRRALFSSAGLTINSSRAAVLAMEDVEGTWSMLARIGEPTALTIGYA